MAHSFLLSRTGSDQIAWSLTMIGKQKPDKHRSRSMSLRASKVWNDLEVGRISA